jgi:hypothetical protein
MPIEMFQEATKNIPDVAGGVVGGCEGIEEVLNVHIF